VYLSAGRTNDGTMLTLGHFNGQASPAPICAGLSREHACETPCAAQLMKPGSRGHVT
jgi:hypothetical protein